MTEHRHAAILRAIADGKRVQVKFDSDIWINFHSGTDMRLLAKPGYEFRIAPDTMMIGNREVEMPSGVGNHTVSVVLDYPYSENVFAFEHADQAMEFRDALVEVAGGCDAND